MVSAQTGGNGGDSSVRWTSEVGGRSSNPQGGVAGTSTAIPRTFLKKNFLSTASNGDVEKIFAVSIDEKGFPSTWDIVPDGITANTYFSASLSKGGRRAAIQNNEQVTFFLADLDTHTTSDLLAAGIDSALPYVETSGWFDDEHLMVDSDPWLSSSPFERWFIRIDPLTRQPFVSSKEDSITTGSISKDGKWVASVWGDVSSDKRLEVASVGDSGVFGVVISEAYSESGSSWATFAPNNRTVSVISTYSNDIGSLAIYDLTQVIPTAKRIKDPNFGDSWFYSPASNYLIGLYQGEILPVVTVATGASRTIRLSENSRVSTITSTDEYAIVVKGSRISSVRFRNSDGSDTVNPTENLLVDHLDERFIDGMSSIHDGRDVIYTLTNNTTLKSEVFWFNVNSPAGTLQNLSKLLGSDQGLSFYVAPSGDYVAIPSADLTKMYLILLVQSPTVQVIDLPPLSAQATSLIEVAWAPDDSGLVIVRGGANATVHFLPRETERSQGFGALRSVELPISWPNELTLTLPERWD